MASQGLKRIVSGHQTFDPRLQFKSITKSLQHIELPLGDAVAGPGGFADNTLQ